MVSQCAHGKIWRRRGGAFQFVQRRRVGKLRDLFARYHALHQRVDHDAVADGGHSATWPAGAGRRRPAKDHAVTRGYATVGLCIFQGYLLALSFQHPESYHTMLPGITDTIRNLGVPLVEDPGWTFRIVTVISLTTGTLFLMWLGDQITERGIGNGISLIITIGIVARLPAALAQAWKTFVPSAQTGTSQVNPAILVLMVAFLFIVIAAVIAITQGVRKITVQYAKRVVGRKQYGGQTSIHAVESELSRRDADHFRLGAFALSRTRSSACAAFKNSPTARADCRRCSPPAGFITSFWRR